MHEASVAGVWVAGESAAIASELFELEPAGEGAFRVLRPNADEDNGDARGVSERRIVTILMTDIVGSTRTVQRVGDRVWSELLAAHEQVTRDELVLYGGREINTTGDGLLASFDSPTRAIRCALAVRDRVAELGLTIRAGVHTGEVEYQDGRVRGIAVHLASRITGRARPGEVLVSATSRELADGAALDFADRGEHTLKGVSEPRRLYAVTG